ncbi:MAG TPA: GH1 family beta-glucosidase [Kofleriaceae bacterium]|nr:GH1 family beta-glucosidase [Kofleriaceae bacterium]
MSEFPADFLWGAATSAYQIEGATREDGRGESIWDRFCRQPGAVANGENGDRACDHYHLWQTDVDLMASLGLKAYRFSIAWPRIQPSGRGAAHKAGVAFYDRLVDRLLERGIQPCATLYHWDLPQALQDAGGWAARDTAGWFTDYADIVFRALGDRVPMFITHNEPWCAAFLGHLRGVPAPGTKDLATSLAAAHHILLSHGRAIEAVRTSAPAAKIGITLSLFPTYPLRGDHEGDHAAAALSDAYTNRWFLDPVLRGVYPGDGLAHMHKRAGRLDFIDPSDLYMISLKPDFLGVNYYHRRVIEDDPDGGDLGWRVHDRSPGVPTTDLGWEIVPQCMTDLLVRLHEDYDVDLYITENGAVFDDVPGPDGTIFDTRRVEFLRAHFQAALAALEKGVKLRGYFVWSLLDNFEWAFGYDKRFGLVHVDYETQKRTPKASARFFSRVIREGLAAAGA